MRFALSKRTLLETGLIKCSKVSQTMTLNEIMNELADLKKKENNLESKKLENSDQKNISEKNELSDNSINDMYEHPVIGQIVETFNSRITEVKDKIGE